MVELIIIFDLSHMQSAVIFAYAEHITLAFAFGGMTMYLLQCHKCSDALRCSAIAYYMKEINYWVEI